MNWSDAARRGGQAARAVFWAALFVLVGRPFDPLGASFKVPSVLIALLAAGLALSGRGFSFWRTAAGKTMALFVAWVLLVILLTPGNPDSFGNALKVAEGAVLFAAAAGLLAATGDSKKALTAIACGGIFAAALGLVWGGMRNGRFALRGGAYEDPNYYAMWLLAAMPLVWSVFARKGLWLKLCGAALTALPLLMALRTASRAGLVALAAMTIALFFLVPLGARILLASAAAVALVVTLSVVPSALKSRLEGTAESRGADSNSADARETLLVTSVAMTLGHPLFGLGPGNFAMSVVEEGRSRGQEWAPLNTHNSYTEISSETGIPGILLLLALICFSFKNAISALRKPSSPETKNMASCLLLSLVGMTTFMFFLNEGYSYLVLLWLGLAAGLAGQLGPKPLSDDL